MKTTIKIGMLSAAFLLVFASCSNAVKPVAVTDATAKPVVQQTTMAEDAQFTKGFIVKKITNKAYGNTDSKENGKYEVQIEFSHAPEMESLKKGVTFATLTPNTSDSSYGEPAEAAVTVAQTRVAGTTAYFELSLVPSKVKDLYVFVNAKEVKAVNGAMLNHDGDDKWAEPHDDSYAALCNPSGSSGLSAHAKIFKHELSTLSDDATATGKNKTLGDLLDMAFVMGKDTTADRFAITGIEVTLKNKTFATNTKLNHGALITLLNSYLKVEEYDWLGNKVSDKNPKFVYNSATGWTASVSSIAHGHYLRARWVDLDKISWESGLYGYPIKCKLENNISWPEAVASTISHNAPFAHSFWPDKDLKADKAVAGQVTITFTPDTNGTTEFKVFAENSWQTVKVENKVSGAVSLFAGFDTTTVKSKKEHFKCFKGNKELIIKDIAIAPNNVVKYPNALNKIVITFEDGNCDVSDVDVYMSPNVKTAGFEGSYGTNKGSNIPSLSFGPKTLTTIPKNIAQVLYGWTKIN